MGNVSVEKIPVEIYWVHGNSTGRKSAPPEHGIYYAVSKFPLDLNPCGSWSVRFFIEKTDKNSLIGYGFVEFLVSDAPQKWLYDSEYFEIYEGPRKVADVKIK